MLSAFSFLQKKILDVPFTYHPASFVIPVLFGGFSGITVSLSYIRLRASRERMRDFINNVDDIIQIVDERGNFLFVNKAWYKTFGYSPLELKRLKVFDIIHPDQIENYRDVFKKLFEDKESIQEMRTVYLSKDGRSVYLEGKLNCRIEKGKAISTRGIFRNITQRQEALEFQKLVANIFERTQEGLVITDSERRISFVNTAFTKITGYSKEDALKKNIHRFFPNARNKDMDINKMAISLAKEGSWQGELWTRRKSGERYPLKMTISVISDEEKGITNYAGIFSDITENKENELRLQHLATHDDLTDLPNRDMFYKQAAVSISESKEKNNILAILFLDLDGFKEVNDQYGHHAGDTLLKLIAQRLRNHTRERDVVARFGGDEFAILLSNISDEKEAKIAAENILKVVSAPFNLGGFAIRITASIGISLYTENTEIDILLIEADKAMYRAKRVGKNRVCIIPQTNEQPTLMDVEPQSRLHP